MTDAKKKSGYNWRPFENARSYVHSLRLKNRHQWRDWSNSPDKPGDIPANPPSVYKDQGWASWGDWLGTGNIAPRNRTFRQFEEARTYARNLGFKNSEEWQNWAKSDAKPDDIPAYPNSAYKDKGNGKTGLRAILNQMIFLVHPGRSN
jgi:hypothetical protein